MRILVDVEVRNCRGGVEARSPVLRLTGHGINEDEAMRSLRAGIVAWCSGLRSIGRLEQRLKDKALKWEPNGQLLTVEMEKRQ